MGRSCDVERVILRNYPGRRAAFSAGHRARSKRIGERQRQRVGIVGRCQPAAATTATGRSTPLGSLAMSRLPRAQDDMPFVISNLVAVREGLWVILANRFKQSERRDMRIGKLTGICNCLFDDPRTVIAAGHNKLDQELHCLMLPTKHDSSLALVRNFRI